MKLGLLRDLLLSPAQGWEMIKEEELSLGNLYFRYVIPLSLIAPTCAFWGTTKVGWTVSESDTVRLTTDSAFRMATLSFLAILVTVMAIGKMIQWMGQTYDTHQALSRCVCLSSFTAIPLLLVGVAMLYPPLWFIYLLGLPALGYSVFLLYSGVPVMMEISKEKGFLFSSAILAVGLVALVGLMVATVSMWGFGIGPHFSS